MAFARRLAAFALVSAAPVFACQTLLDFTPSAGAASSSDASGDAADAADVTSAADGFVPEVDAHFECPSDPTVRCTTFEDDASPQGSFDPVSQNSAATVSYDVADAGAHGRSMHIRTTSAPASANFAANLGLLSAVECQVSWRVENAPSTNARMSLLTFFLSNGDEVRADIVGFDGAVLLFAQTVQALDGATAGWNRLSIALKLANRSGLEVIANVGDGAVVDVPFPASTTGVRVVVGPDLDPSGWDVRLDDVLCRPVP